MSSANSIAEVAQRTGDQIPDRQPGAGDCSPRDAAEGSSRPPRVMHLITRLIRGGADENTLFTANGLSEMGYDCWLVCGGGSDAQQLDRAHDVETIVLPEMVRRIAPLRDLRAFWRLLMMMRRIKPDIVHTHTAKAGVLGRLAAHFASVPIVIHGLHGTTFHPGQSALLRRTVIGIERMMADFTDLFVSVSDDLSQLYMDEAVGHPLQHTTVRSGMDIDKFRRVARWDREQVRRKRRELGVPVDEPTALLVSRLEPRKRVERFIEAAGRLSREGVPGVFAIAGEGPSRPELEQQARDLGVADRVFFLGFRQDIPEVLASANAVCLTSAWEGLPRVFVEASLVGRMIVCYDVNGASEVITCGENGFVAPQDDPARFCARLAEVLQSGELQTGPHSHLGSDPIDRWSVESMIADTAAVYRDILPRSGCADEVSIPPPRTRSDEARRAVESLARPHRDVASS
jgi:glycosyltransferase involved in cell wall biosynthesis